MYRAALRPRARPLLEYPSAEEVETFPVPITTDAASTAIVAALMKQTSELRVRLRKAEQREKQLVRSLRSGVVTVRTSGCGAMRLRPNGEAREVRLQNQPDTTCTTLRAAQRSMVVRESRRGGSGPIELPNAVSLTALLAMCAEIDPALPAQIGASGNVHDTARMAAKVVRTYASNSVVVDDLDAHASAVAIE